MRQYSPRARLRPALGPDDLDVAGGNAPVTQLHGHHVTPRLEPGQVHLHRVGREIDIPFDPARPVEPERRHLALEAYRLLQPAEEARLDRFHTECHAEEGIPRGDLVSLPVESDRRTGRDPEAGPDNLG